MDITREGFVHVQRRSDVFLLRGARLHFPQLQENTGWRLLHLTVFPKQFGVEKPSQTCMALGNVPHRTDMI